MEPNIGDYQIESETEWDTESEESATDIACREIDLKEG